MRSKEFVSTLSTPVLQRTVRNQQHPRRRLRYEPTVVYHLAEQAKARGVDLSRADGPWRADERPLERPGRNDLDVIPIITNETTAVMVDTKEHAVDLAGLLNWSGVHQLEPIPDLTPPE
ncbi:MAG TPA: hypothetical protein VJ808_12885 [Gemmatimonadales bacterium]|nr:hypothetical protein [Gemmatimonadales bacterium]